MTVRKGKKSLVLAVTAFLSVLILWGCTSIRYAYDTKTGFSGLRSYAWAPSSAMYGGQDYLLETNVRVLADQLVGQKGFTRVAEKPDLLISMNYESETAYGQYGYQLRMLTLNIYKSEQKELVWRGTAAGNIRTDAASGDLRKAVEGILANFPPK
jgi:hypothetical protein